MRMHHFVVGASMLGLVLLGNAAGAVEYNVNYNVDRPGGDYNHLVKESPQACAATCSFQGLCKAWAWVKSTHVCWLKDRVPQAYQDARAHSGIKKQPEMFDLRGDVELQQSE